jgi:hypothetical protein
MLPYCLPGSSQLSIKKISAPDSGLSRHATFDPYLPVALLQSAIFGHAFTCLNDQFRLTQII